MNRRQVIVGAAALGAAAAVPLAAAATPSVDLEATRAFLLPGLWVTCGDGSDLSGHIVIDRRHESLVVAMVHTSNPSHELAFAITRESIVSGRYKAEFGAGLARLRKCILEDAGVYEPMSEQVRQ